MKDEAPYRPDHELLIAIGEADHLQFEIILVGPEPGRVAAGIGLPVIDAATARACSSAFGTDSRRIFRCKNP